jgi:hypothetical protein
MQDEKQIASIQQEAEDFDSDELRDWGQDRRGQAFWANLKLLFSLGVSEQRDAARNGESVKAAYSAGKTDVIEEVLQMIDLMIQDKKKKAQEESK